MSSEVELARVTERLEGVADRFEEHVERVEKRHDDHEARIRLLEKWRYAIPPAVILATAGVVIEIVRGS